MGSPTLPPEEKREEEGAAISRLRRGRCLSWNRNWSMTSFASKCWRSLDYWHFLRLQREWSQKPNTQESLDTIPCMQLFTFMRCEEHFCSFEEHTLSCFLLVWGTYAFLLVRFWASAKQVANPQHFTSVEIVFHFKLWTVYYLRC